MVTFVSDIQISLTMEQLHALINLSKKTGIGVENLAMTAMMQGLLELEKEYEISKTKPKLELEEQIEE